MDYDVVQFSQYCGVIGLGTETIEVLPKVYSQGNRLESGRGILLRMLYLARRMKISPIGVSGINLQRHYLLDVFIRNFCEELFEQLHRGALLRYIYCEDNLPVLRGRLLIDRHLKFNSGRLHRLYCGFDELVEDNEYNQYIKCALRVVHSKACSLIAKRLATELLHRFDGVRDQRPEECRGWVLPGQHSATRFRRGRPERSGRSCKTLPEQRDTKRFESVFRQCGWFLHGLGPDVTAGEWQSLSVLFDMNRLFEEFIAAKLRKETRGAGFRVCAPGRPQYYLAQAANGADRFLLKPDITLLDAEDKVLSVLDTKWKTLSEDKAARDVDQADLYQMVAYGTRYQCKNLTLIYPRRDGMPEEGEFEFSVQKSNLKITVRFVDLEQLVKPGLDAQLSRAAAA